MTMSDPIADMLTRIRNANTAKHDTVDVPSSKMKLAIANILVNEGYIAKYDLVEDGIFQTIKITLKYGKDKNEKIISGIKRISKPGLRVYANKEELPRVLGGLGTAIISTNEGVITDKEARRLGVGASSCGKGRFHVLLFLQIIVVISNVVYKSLAGQIKNPGGRAVYKVTVMGYIQHGAGITV